VCDLASGGIDLGSVETSWLGVGIRRVPMPGLNLGTVNDGMGQATVETHREHLVESPVVAEAAKESSFGTNEDVVHLTHLNDSNLHQLPGQMQNTWHPSRCGVAMSLVALGLVLVAGATLGLKFMPALHEANKTEFDNKILHAEEMVAVRRQVGRASLALGSAALKAVGLSAQCQDALPKVFHGIYRQLASKVSESCKENIQGVVCKAASSKFQDPDANIIDECEAHGHRCMISVKLPKGNRQNTVCLPGACRKDFAQLANVAEQLLLQNSATCTSGLCALDLSCSS